MMYNAIANGGRLMKPYLISAIREYGKDVKTFEPTTLIESVGDSNVIAQLRKCTEAVVTMGTGKHIQSPHYAIAGKTGTAQVADLVDGKGYGYKAGMYQGSFVGYFPADKPRYTIAVVIRTKPHSGAYYGGTIAAPVFRMVADKIFASSKGGWDGPLDSLAQTTAKKMVAKQATAKAYYTMFNSLGNKVKTESDNK